MVLWLWLLVVIIKIIMIIVIFLWEKEAFLLVQSRPVEHCGFPVLVLQKRAQKVLVLLSGPLKKLSFLYH